MTSGLQTDKWNLYIRSSQDDTDVVHLVKSSEIVITVQHEVITLTDAFRILSFNGSRMKSQFHTRIEIPKLSCSALQLALPNHVTCELDLAL